jgi:O-antigen ligase
VIGGPLASRSSRSLGPAIALLGCVAGLTLAAGRADLVVVVLIVAAFVVLLAVSPRKLVFGVLVFALAPALLGVPSALILGGRAIYFTDFLLPAAAIWCLYAGERGAGDHDSGELNGTRTLGVAFNLFVVAILVALMIGLRNGADVALMLRDVRGPVYIASAFIVTVRLVRSADRRRVVIAVSMLLWVSSVLVLLESVTGVNVLGGRVEDVSRVENRASSVGVDATRFILGPTNLALFVLCASSVAVVAGRRPIIAWFRFFLALVLPGLILVFFSFSRRSLVAIAVSTLAGLLFKPNTRSIVRLASLVVVVVSVLAVLGALLAGSDNYFAEQVSAFQARVVTGLSDDSRSQDLGLRWRSIENEYASRVFQDAPLAGRGFGAIYRPSLRGQPFEGAEILYGRAYVHSLYYWWLVKGGLLGLSAFAFLVISSIRSGLRAARTYDDTAFYALSIGLIGLASVSFVAPIFNEVPTATFLGCVLGWLRVSLPTSIESDLSRESDSESVALQT